jgi:polysaccharide biosynthesis protein PslH
MSHPLRELRILHRKAIYPGRFGGNLRTINIARLALAVCERTTLYSMDNAIDFEGMVAGVPVIQEKEFRNGWEKTWYYFYALTARELIIPYTKRAFLSAERSLFQIEDPLFYPLLKQNHISRFILDEHNVNWETSGFAHPDYKQRIYGKIASKRDRENEKQALLHAAHVLCCSDRDRSLLISEIPELQERISVIPNCVNVHDYDALLDAKQRRDSKKGRILFVGLMAYAPNVEAARLIYEVIAPRAVGCEFIIAGKNPPKFRYHQNVTFPGYVEDIKTVMADADICIAPIRSGSGTRIKILEYMAMGKPVISTSKGAEGIEYTDGVNVIIEDTIENYPEIIRELLDDEKKRVALGREARKLIEEKYDWDLYQKSLEKIYANVMEDT